MHLFSALVSKILPDWYDITSILYIHNMLTGGCEPLFHPYTKEDMDHFVSTPRTRYKQINMDVQSGRDISPSQPLKLVL
jgi:hypothetical protein